MAESMASEERPSEPAIAQSISRALEHLRPFPPIDPAHRGVEQPSHPTSSTAPAQQNGSQAHNSNGLTSAAIPPLATVIERIHARVHAFLNESHPADSLLASVQKQTRISLDVVIKSLSEYKLSEMSLSYNGGKDCLVLLILFLAGLHPPQDNHRDKHRPRKRRSDSLHLRSPPDPFPSVEEFVVSSAQAYHLSITKYTTSPPKTTIRTVFDDYLQRHPDIKAIFVGIRRTDPHGAKLTHFDRTDHGWPDFMRIHPMIDWHYAEIWAFIRHLDLEFCDLYRQGYTSLGGTSDTKPNPKLRKEGGSDAEYLPAYELTEDVEERLGRY
ncbi:hypothetical protein N7526_001571 [Penicillium atrosanguineum]|nr:hypothetical protein N7526_001571 [Penicillium atrosanguineum]